MFLYISNLNITISQLQTIRILNKNPSKFCIFSVSNGGAKERNDFFTKLSQYKKVDSCGKHLNNMGYNCPGGHSDSVYFEFISNYKFMICFENTSKTNYLTEKLVNAYYSGTIPIYWGCPNIADYINMNSILYLPPNYTDADINQLIQEVIRLDSDPQAYKEKYEQSFLLQNPKIDTEFLQEKICNSLNLMV
jgi:hypothetical protein